jgi:hypothetical protein
MLGSRIRVSATSGKARSSTEVERLKTARPFWRKFPPQSLARDAIRPPSPPRSGGEGRGEVALRVQGATPIPDPFTAHIAETKS